MKSFFEDKKVDLAKCDFELVRFADKGSRKMYNMSLTELRKGEWYQISPEYEELLSLALIGCDADDINWADTPSDVVADFKKIFLDNAYEYTPPEERGACSRKSFEFLDLVVKGALKSYKTDITPLFNDSGAKIAGYLLLSYAHDGVVDEAGSVSDVKVYRTAELAYESFGIADLKVEAPENELKLTVDRYDPAHRDDSTTICTFESGEKAEVALMAIIDRSLCRHYVPGLTSEELKRRHYYHSGDPCLSGPLPPLPFVGEVNSRRNDYERMRCKELCQDEDAVSSVLRYPTWPTELSFLRDILLTALQRENLDDREIEGLQEFLSAIDNYPNAMPKDWYIHYFFTIYQGDTKYEARLEQRKIKFYTDATSPETYWKIHFWGTGRRDRREGDLDQALGLMLQAVLDPATVVQ